MPTKQAGYSSESKHRESAARTTTFPDGRRRPLWPTSPHPSSLHITMAAYDSLRRALSAERLSTYERIASACSPDVTADSLYLWNMRMCGALMMPVHLCEVVTRNAAATVLARQHGPRWPWNDAFRRRLPAPVLPHAQHWNRLPSTRPIHPRSSPSFRWCSGSSFSPVASTPHCGYQHSAGFCVMRLRLIPA